MSKWLRTTWFGLALWSLLAALTPTLGWVCPMTGQLMDDSAAPAKTCALMMRAAAASEPDSSSLYCNACPRPVSPSGDNVGDSPCCKPLQFPVNGEVRNGAVLLQNHTARRDDFVPAEALAATVSTSSPERTAQFVSHAETPSFRYQSFSPHAIPGRAPPVPA
ncbi:MAG TPA: hypothetical protein VF719_08540 [Abditibacteriaceae bacterium]